MDPNKHAIRFVAVGLGQCGGNIANAFAQRGYRAFAVNASAADMERLSHIGSEARLSISVEGGDGAGKDPELGASSVWFHSAMLRERIGSSLSGDEVLLVCAGLGGGTGSAAAALIEALKPLGTLMAALVTVPAKHESGLCKVNAVRAVDGLIGADLDGLLVVDNQRVLEQFAEHQMDRYLSAANERIVEMVDRVNSIHGSTRLVAGAVDRSELSRTLLAGGFSRTGIIDVGTPLPSRGDALADRLLAALEDDSVFSGGADLGQAAFVSAMVVAPRTVLQAAPRNLVHDTRTALRERTGGAAAYVGAFVAPDGAPVQVLCAVGGLGYPASLHQLLAAALDEGRELSEKVHADIGTVDTDGLDTIDELTHRRWRKRTGRGSSPPAADNHLRDTVRPPRTREHAPSAEIRTTPGRRLVPEPASSGVRPVEEDGIVELEDLTDDLESHVVEERDAVHPGPSALPAAPPPTGGAAVISLDDSRRERSAPEGVPLEKRVADIIRRGRSASTDHERRMLSRDVWALYESPLVATRMAALTAAVLAGADDARSLLKQALTDPANEVRRKAMLLLSADRGRPRIAVL